MMRHTIHSTKGAGSGRFSVVRPVDSLILSITAGEFRFIDENGDERLAKRTEAKEPDEPPATMGYRLDRLALYQPAEVMAERITDDAKLAGYEKALEIFRLCGSTGPGRCRCCHPARAALQDLGRLEGSRSCRKGGATKATGGRGTGGDKRRAGCLCSHREDRRRAGIERG